MKGKTQQAAAAASDMSERSVRNWNKGPLPSEKKDRRGVISAMNTSHRSILSKITEVISGHPATPAVSSSTRNDSSSTTSRFRFLTALSRAARITFLVSPRSDCHEKNTVLVRSSPVLHLLVKVNYFTSPNRATHTR